MRKPAVERFNEWCDDLLEAIFCDYFPTLVVVLFSVVALVGSFFIWAAVFEL